MNASNHENLEKEFDAAMRDIAEEAQEAQRLLGKSQHRFVAMIDRLGGRCAAIALVTSGSEPQTGLKEVISIDRPDLSAEHLMLTEKFKLLFSDAERAAARWRLEHSGAITAE